MKKALLSLLLLCFMSTLVISQGSDRMALLANWDDNTLPARGGLYYNDCWGYTDSNGKEYAIMGGAEHIFFFDLSTPSSPVLVDSFGVNGTTPGLTMNPSLWRDFKTYGTYAYAVADEGTEGLIIFDLSNLPTSVDFVSQTTAFFNRSHNIFIDEPAGRIYLPGSYKPGLTPRNMVVLDVATDPQNPTEIGRVNLPGGYVHDVHVGPNNTAYCSHGGNGLYVYDFTTASAPVELGHLTGYTGAGYNHSSWLNEAGTHLVFCDETRKKMVKIANVTDPMAISITDQFYSNLLDPDTVLSIVHNPFIRGDFAFMAYYHDGVQIFDISDPTDVSKIAYYDTYPTNNNYNGFSGVWGVYPFFDSGIIIASDDENGLFVLDPDLCKPPHSPSEEFLTQTTVKVSWPTVEDAAKYKISYRILGNTSWTTKNTINPYRTITGLTMDTTYEYRLKSFCSFGLTEWSDTFTFSTPLPCNTPQNLSVSNITPSSATVSWDSEPGAINYKVYYRVAGSTTGWTRKSAPVNMRALNGLAPSTNYEVKVKALCDSGFTPFSSLAFFTTSGSFVNNDPGNGKTSSNKFNSFKAFPSPVNGQTPLTLLFDQALSEGLVEVYDLNGKKVFAQNIQNQWAINSVEFTLPELSNGLYLIRVSTSTSQLTQKISVVR